MININELEPGMLLTGAEVREILRITRACVHTWVQRGWLTPINIAPPDASRRSLRFRSDELIAIISKQPKAQSGQ